MGCWEGAPPPDGPTLNPHFLVCCRGSQAAAQAAFAAYQAASPPPWPARPPGTTLSYVATCYTLLHELELMSSVFKREPELWEARSLGEVQVAVWGWLDGAAAGPAGEPSGC